MTAIRVTTRAARIRREKQFAVRVRQRKWLLIFCIGTLVVAMSVFSIWRISSIRPAPVEPPEAAKILKAQESIGKFGILIPAYLPEEFDRASVNIGIDQSGPSGESLVELAYRTKKDAALFIRQWVPANPELEILNGSRPIQTKWGKSWLLTQQNSLLCIWVDVGPLRVSMATRDLDIFSREKLVLAAESLGLASNLQAYSFVTELPTIKDIAPPPPFEVAVNVQGIQELNLTITPGGFSPMRFVVQKGIPVKINFRALGQVGCGNTLIFPVTPDNFAALTLTSEQEMKTIEFTPEIAGDFGFRCTTNCYRGIMTVEEKPRHD